MLPIKLFLILIIATIGLIEPSSARIPRHFYNEPQNYTYGRLYGGRNSKPVDDRLIDDEEIDNELADENDNPYLWVSNKQIKLEKRATFSIFQNREEYPNPILQPMFCRNKSPSHICDPDDILTKREKLTLEKMIRQISTDVNCYCANCTIDSNGITIGIALMKAMHKPYL